MGLPAFLMRKLYQRGSLRQTADGCFAFRIHNPLGPATLLRPPRFVINGIHYDPADVDADVDLAAIDEDHPLAFPKGIGYDLRFPGHLLRGANRIHMTVLTKEFGQLELFVEDKEADFCEVPHVGEEE